MHRGDNWRDDDDDDDDDDDNNNNNNNNRQTQQAIQTAFQKQLCVSRD